VATTFEFHIHYDCLLKFKGVSVFIHCPLFFGGSNPNGITNRIKLGKNLNTVIRLIC